MAQMRTLTDMPCVLDFYVHEGFQRQGVLTWHMAQYIVHGMVHGTVHYSVRCVVRA